MTTREMGRTGVVAGLGVVVAVTASVAPLRPSRPAPDPGFAPGPADGARVAQEVDTLTAATGTEVRLMLRDSLSTRASAAGDTFRAEVAEPVYDGERIVLPMGAVVTGRVTEVRESGGARERAMLHTGFLDVAVDGDTVPFSARLAETNPVMRSRISTAERSAWIGGGALAGGLVGGYFTGGSGALAGAAVGGLAAAVWVMTTQDVDVLLPAGSELRVSTTREIEVER